MSETDPNWSGFLDRLAHDMREPLRAINTFSELLGEAAKGRLDSESLHLLEEIRAGSSRMGMLVDSLSKYALALDESEPSEASLQLAFHMALASLNSEIRASGAVITSDPLPRVGIRLERLAQLLENIISNSLRFRSDAPPVVHVSADPCSNDGEKPERWLIRVRDNGIGIEAEECETALKPFNRLNGRKYPGVGLGLTICRRIVENHGGTICLEPAGSAGTICSFTLPAA
jgi:chemotaxis family two-component system sensor kinase Cph1